MIGIYQLRSLTTGKIYVGQSKNIKERMKYHRWDSKKQNKSEWPLYIDFNKYGFDDSVLEVYDGVRIAERANNLPNDMVGKVCRGSKYRKTAGGFKWKYIPEEEV